MEGQNYHTTIRVSADAMEAFGKITHVSGWWTADFEGSSQQINDHFRIRFGETHVDFTVIESIPGRKQVWLVTDCNLHWLKDKNEWKGTKMSFEILPEGDFTEIKATHIGLIPAIECYADCKKGWDFFIRESLFKYLTEGKGMPETPKFSR